VLSEFRKQAAELGARPGCAGVLGLRLHDGAVEPAFLEKAEEFESVTLEPKWPLAKLAWRTAQGLAEDEFLGLVCRGCDMRALAELEKAGQLRPGAVQCLGVPCSAEQAKACSCSQPSPPGQESQLGVDFLKSESMIELLESDHRFELWQEHFGRCIKCYGCRNSCPICVCPSCKLEDPGYVETGRLPPEPLVFHLIRAMHLADRCVGCGACQDSCPSGLPLLALHQWLRSKLSQRYGFVSGSSAVSPLLSIQRERGPLGAAAPVWGDTRSKQE